ncbi:unnamed protein product [Ixodes persulcatus]
MQTTSLVLLVALAAAASAFVCLPDFCKNVKCKEVTVENCRGRVSVKGSLCGCCDSCILQLGVGERCLELLPLGVPPTAECKPGLHCDESAHTCVPLEESSSSPSQVADEDTPRTTKEH